MSSSCEVCICVCVCTPPLEALLSFTPSRHIQSILNKLKLFAAESLSAAVVSIIISPTAATHNVTITVTVTPLYYLHCNCNPHCFMLAGFVFFFFLKTMKASLDEN